MSPESLNENVERRNFSQGLRDLLEFLAQVAVPLTMERERRVTVSLLASPSCRGGFAEMTDVALHSPDSRQTRLLSSDAGVKRVSARNEGKVRSTIIPTTL